MTDHTGQQFGNYRLSRLLGRGGFAEVYLGEHIHLQTQAAIKILSTQLIATDLQTFMQEARTLVALDHLHIMHVLDCGIEDETPFLVMVYAPNGTLRQQHPKGTRVPLSNVLSYVSQIASALQYAHDRQLIHRDVKPENMLIGRDGELLLSDFGIAVISATSTSQHTKAVTGTASYMAPEQIMGKPHKASDQYALGIAVYEWLISDYPFHGSFLELCAQHLHAPPPSLVQIDPSIPVEVENVVIRALAKDPNNRFPSIQDFATELLKSCPDVQPAPIKRAASEELTRNETFLVSPSNDNHSLFTNNTPPHVSFDHPYKRLSEPEIEPALPWRPSMPLPVVKPPSPAAKQPSQTSPIINPSSPSLPATPISGQTSEISPPTNSSTRSSASNASRETTSSKQRVARSNMTNSPPRATSLPPYIERTADYPNYEPTVKAYSGSTLPTRTPIQSPPLRQGPNWGVVSIIGLLVIAAIVAFPLLTRPQSGGAGAQNNTDTSSSAPANSSSQQPTPSTQPTTPPPQPKPTTPPAAPVVTPAPAVPPAVVAPAPVVTPPPSCGQGGGQETLKFTADTANNPNSQQIPFTNPCDTTLNWSATTSTDKNLSWLSIDRTSGTLGGRASDVINVNIDNKGKGLSVGDYHGTVTITLHKDSGDITATIDIVLTVTDASGGGTTVTPPDTTTTPSDTTVTPTPTH